jgi:hypothetical protein
VLGGIPTSSVKRVLKVPSDEQPTARSAQHRGPRVAADKDLIVVPPRIALLAGHRITRVAMG